MKKVIIFLLIITFFSCSKKSDSIPLDPIGSSLVKSKEFDELSIENYSSEANKILEKHKKKLKILLPSLIEEEIEIYKNVLVEIEKAPIKNTTFSDTNQYIEESLISLETTLMEKELILNEVNFQLFNELLVLNYKYRSFKNDVDFIDFYDAGPIVLSDEVLIKIEEMIKDEKIRLELEKKTSNSQKAAFGLDAILGLLRFTKCGKTLKSITVGVKAANDKLFLKSAANFTSKVAWIVYSKKMSKTTAFYLNNQKKRDNISKISETGVNSILILDAGASIYQYNLSNSFKEINNKINGRIGDFSDGILAGHLQRVRDIIKANKAMLTSTAEESL